MARRLTSCAVPLWAAGFAAWPLVTWVVAALLPSERGPYSERPGAWALVAGGVCALALWIVDFVRDRRIWLGALIAWAVLFCVNVAGAARSSDPDVDQQIGWAFFLPGLILFPVFSISLAAETWARRKRRWRVEFEGTKVVFVRRS